MHARRPMRTAVWSLALVSVLASLPVHAAQTADDGAGAATEKVIDGRTADWVGESPMIGGASTVSQGEYVYQDYIYDDLGAYVLAARNASGINGMYEIDSDTPTVTMNLRGNTEKRPIGTFVYPDDESRYGNNAADLFQFRASRVGDRVNFLVVLTTLLRPDTTVVGIALGGDGAELVEWPHGAKLKTPGTQHVLTLASTGAMFDNQPLESVGGQMAVSVVDNAFEVSVPVSLVGTRFRAYVGTGLWDAAAKTWMQVQKTRTTTVAGGSDGARPNVFNVAFRNDEAQRNGPGPYDSNPWWELAQSAALAKGDIAKYHADIDLDAADSPDTRITGYHQRIYRSPSTIAPHEGVSWTGTRAKNGMTSAIGQWTYHFYGPWQPYAVYIPQEKPKRMTVVLHGSGSTFMGAWSPGMQKDLGNANQSILVEPLARGAHNGYAEYADLAVFEAMADAEKHYKIDPALTVLSGISMGGIGTYRLAALHPDRFAAAIIWSSCAGGPGAACASPEESVDLFPNLRHVEAMIHHGGADPLITGNHAPHAAAALEELGYPHEMYFFTFAGHTSVVEWSNYRFERDFIARQKPIDPNPAHVTYRTSEGWWSPEISPQLVYDHAYWVSGLRVRDTTLGDRAFGTVDAVTHGRGGTEPATQAIEPVYRNVPPNQHLYSGRKVVPGGTPIPQGNRFTATLENLRAASFDLKRMSLTTVSAPLSATIETDGAATVRLLGSGPVSVAGAVAAQDGNDVIVTLPAAGTHQLTITRK